MIKTIITNEILKYITEIEKNKFKISNIELPKSIVNTLRKNSKKKSTFASNKIEGNPLSEKQVNEILDSDEKKHYLKPEQEIRNYFLAINYLDECFIKKEKFSKKLILNVQKLVEKGASKEKIGFRGQMPPGVLFAVYDSKTGNPDYIPPEYVDIEPLINDLINYVNSSDDHPLIIAAMVHYQMVTIHPFEDGNGRTARLLSSYILNYYGYGFNGIGSIEEYFAYDIDEYYNSIQMGLPALYYLGRNNPPHIEIWLEYFLKMMYLYSTKVSAIQIENRKEQVNINISHLKEKDIKLLLFILKTYKNEFTPVQLSNKLNESNRTIINRLIRLVNNGFVEPLLVKERIRFYRLSEFSKGNKKEILKEINNELETLKK